MLCAAMTLAFTGCGSDDPAPARERAAPPTQPPAAGTDAASAPAVPAPAAPETADTSELGPMVLVAPSATHGWMAAIEFWATEWFEMMGIADKMGFHMLLSPDVDAQKDTIPQALALNPSVIVLMPHNAGLTEAANAIEEAGVPMILFDRWVDSPRTAHVTGANWQIGYNIGRRMGEFLEGEGIVALMNAPAIGSVNDLRVEGFLTSIADYPNIEVLDFYIPMFTEPYGLEYGTALLDAHPHIDAIASINDVPSRGVLEAVQTAGRTDVRAISGAGGWQQWFHPMYDNPDIYLFTYTYFPSMVMDALLVAYDYIHGRDISGRGLYPNDWIIPPIYVSRANVTEFFNDDTPY